ncbi:MAG: ApaLI family restriction endonuclease [bacterium]|nr:ApaLI family restriction endonuclease [bacterium]
MTDLEQAIRQLSMTYATALRTKTQERIAEMEKDDKGHYLIYRLLGISADEGDAIDLYQNKGRLLYRYAGALLENATRLCFVAAFPEAVSLKIPNTLGSRPKTFEIDCVVADRAYEIKWRDATTDGDHITKEHTRLKAIAAAGYTPIRLMYYYPNRQQAARIQNVLEDLYKANGGQYYAGNAAWAHIHHTTGIDLLALLTAIAGEQD